MYITCLVARVKALPSFGNVWVIPWYYYYYLYFTPFDPISFLLIWFNQQCGTALKKPDRGTSLTSYSAVKQKHSGVETDDSKELTDREYQPIRLGDVQCRPTDLCCTCLLLTIDFRLAHSITWLYKNTLAPDWLVSSLDFIKKTLAP